MDPEHQSRRRPAERPEPGQASQRRPGSHDPEGNRHAVLEAARRLFGAHGYRGVGVRAIAAEAGVTPGLVMAYFGTKDGLFREAVAGGTGVTGDVLSAMSAGADKVPAALARAYLGRWDSLPADDPWPALIRSALSHPPSAELLRTILEKQVGEPLARLLGDSAGADVRAALIRSVLFGVIMERYLFAHEPAASVPAEEFAPALTDVLVTAFGDALDAVPPPPARHGTADGETDPVSPAAPAPPLPADFRPQFQGPAADGLPAALFARLDACSAAHQELIGRTLREYGISLSAYDVLAALRDAGEPYRRTTGEVAAAGRVRAGGLTQHVDRLEAAGLVERERDADDRRIIRLRLTAEGLELADRVHAVRSAQEQELLAGLSAADRRRLAGLLGALGDSVEASARGR
ncbi:TetR/AcrR family transcriptional regulator [Streptomyces sp. OR43]|uniref:TetR/AcrR family transcriptional regulator n=1 Tax=Streptomyces sp. or43 TaxID=2478957 RepID=UPI0011CE90D4|nr:TetR family transcriptional regulator [Streptomyces sp. or43]TXS43723.1 TetR family transcriptional regulator [Streptomyces sp. or43]